MNVGLAVIVVSGQVILNIIKNHLTNTVIIVNIVFVKTEKKLRKLGFFLYARKKQKTTKNKVKKLKAKKKYYVRVRTYKTVKGKKVYSSWSKVKSIKTK